MRKFRSKLIDALEGLLDTVINQKTNATVRDEIGEAPGLALDHLKERLKTRGLENDRLTAETLLILEQVQDLREKRKAAIKRSNAQTETIILDNLNRKIALVKTFQSMVDELEPSAIVSLYGEFAPAGLPPPPKAITHQPKK